MTTAALLTLCIKTCIWGTKGYAFNPQFPLPDACIHLAGNNAGCLDVYSHGSLQQHKSISLGDTPVSCEIILWILQGMLSEGQHLELQDTRGKASKITTFGTGFQTPLCLQTPEPFCISWVSLGKYKGSQLTFPYYQAQEAIGEPLSWHISFEPSTGVCNHGRVVEVRAGRPEPPNYNVYLQVPFIF